MSNTGTNPVMGTEDRATLELWAESVIDCRRFPSVTDRLLSRHEDVDALLPDADTLSARGVDIVELARLLEMGLDAGEYGKALENGFDEESLAALMQGADVLTPSGVERVNAGLTRFNEMRELTAPVQLALERRGR